MTHLLLDEQPVVAILDEVGDVGVAQTVRTQPDVQPASAAACANAALNRSSLTRGARSDGHSPQADPLRTRGHTPSTHSSSTSTDHGITVSTLRRRGGDPRKALPHRT